MEETQEKLVKISLNSAEFSLKLANTKAKKVRENSAKIRQKPAKNKHASLTFLRLLRFVSQIVTDQKNIPDFDLFKHMQICFEN